MALTRPKYSSILDTDFKVSCKVATTGSDIPLTGGAPSTLDGEPLSVGDRILVKDQSLAWQNGIYVVSTVGAANNGTWSRAKDFAASTNVTSGIMIPVTQGTTRGGRIYLLTTPDPIVLNTTNLTFTDVTFAPANTVSISNANVSTSTTTGAFTVTGGVGVGGNIYVGGNANITGTANITGNAEVTGAANITGNISGGNISTTGALSVTGNASAGNISTTGVLSVTGNANVGNLGTAGSITATGNITGGNIKVGNITVGSDAITSVHDTITIDPSTSGASGNVIIQGNLQVTGTTTTIDSTTVTVNDLNIILANNAPDASSANGAGLTIAGANATWTYNSTSNTWVSNIGANITGNANVTANLSAGNISTAGILSVTGNANVGNLETNIAVITTGNITTINSGLMQNGNSNIAIAANGNVTISADGKPNVITVFGNGVGVQKTIIDSELSVYVTAAIGANINQNDFFSSAQALVVGDFGKNSGITIVTQSNGEGSINFADGNTGSARGEGYIFYDHTAHTMTMGVYNTATAGSKNVLVLSNSNATVNGNIIGSNISTAGTLNVTGNANVGNLGTVDIVATGVSNLNSVSNVKISGGSNGQFIQTDGAGNLSFVTLSPSSIFNGNSNVSVAANANVTVSVAGNANIVTVTGVGANIAGTLDVTGNANVGNLGVGQLVPTTIYANGTVGSAGQFLSSTGTGLDWVTLSANSISNGNSNVVVSANSNVTISAVGNANIVTVSGTGANIAGTLDVTGNVTVSNLTANGTVNLGSNANVKISGGTLNQFLQTDGTGNLSWSSSAGGGITFTANTSPPVGPTVGDQWYDTGADILFTRINDGSGDLWLDITSTGNTFSALTASNISVIDTANVANLNANGITTIRGYTGGTVGSAVATYTKSLVIGGIYNQSYNSGNAAIVHIADYSNDAGDNVYPMYVEDENNVVDFYLYAGTDGTATTKRAYFGGNVGIGNTAPTHKLTVAGNIVPSANGTSSLGNTSLRWSNIWGLASSAQYADLAEKYLADETYSSGTVVIFGGKAEITVTTQTHDSRVAGVISTEPAYLMNDNESQGNLWLPVALTGRVPCRVIGPVKKGDVLVTSSIEGVAKKLDKSMYEPGCIIGKSLEDHIEDTIKTIEVVVGRF